MSWDWQKQCMIEVECAAERMEQLEQENGALRREIERLSAELRVLTDDRPDPSNE